MEICIAVSFINVQSIHWIVTGEKKIVWLAKRTLSAFSVLPICVLHLPIKSSQWLLLTTKSAKNVITNTKKNSLINTTITVRKTLQGVGIERIFLLHSPKVDSITLLRSSKVRRSKLYYLRNLRGKATRLKQTFK